MAVTSPDNLRTPNPGDPYNLVADLAILAQDTQDALTRRANVFNGTVSQRTAFTSTATNGMLWQDTDGIKMIWRKDGAAWVPAVWRWSGTTAQMNGFTQAPNGFEWFDTTVNSTYLRLSGAWSGDTGWQNLNSSLVTAYAGACEGRKSGGLTEVRYSSLAKSVPVGVTTVGTLPVVYRPIATPQSLSVRGVAYFDSAPPGSMQLSSDGSLNVINNSGSARTFVAGSLVFIS